MYARAQSLDQQIHKALHLFFTCLPVPDLALATVITAKSAGQTHSLEKRLRIFNQSDTSTPELERNKTSRSESASFQVPEFALSLS